MRKLFLFTILALVLPLVIRALDSKAIVTEWDVTFQSINLAHFTDWPKVDGSTLVDVSSAAGRVWLIWPRTIINLSASGMSDSKSLLSLFSSQTANWNRGSWTPENGILSSRGDWLGYLEDKLYRLDLQSGRVRSADWKEGLVDSLFAAPDGNLITLKGTKAYYVDFSRQALTSALGSDVPSVLAVSTQRPEFAWLDRKGIHLVSVKDGRKEIIPLEDGLLPSGSPWGASWLRGSLVLAYPGTLYAVDLSAREAPRISRFEARWLPGRWYRLRGGGDLLLVHTPETGKLWIYGAEEKASNAPIPGYKDFFAKHAIPAGQLLEKKKEFEAAVRYYNWALPQIRAFRSGYPLEEVWAELEHELVERRLVLLQLD